MTKKTKFKTSTAGWRISLGSTPAMPDARRSSKEAEGRRIAAFDGKPENVGGRK
jgi:hypothetical protein